MLRTIRKGNPVPDLRARASAYLAALLVAAIALTLVAGTLFDPILAPQPYTLALVCYALTLVAWVISFTSETTARWLSALGLLALMLGLTRWLGTVVLPLAGLVTVLTVPLLGLGGSVLVALLQTGALAAMGMADGDLQRGLLVTASISIWIGPFVSFLAQRPARVLSEWALDYFQSAQSAVEETRDRRAELRQALDDLAHANRRLTLINENQASLRLLAEQAQRTKAAFLSKVSHEFRTPLNMIIGLTELLLESPDLYGQSLSPMHQEHLAIINRNSQHLASLVNDVLDLSQVEAGRMALHRERFSLAEVISRSVEVVSPYVAKKQLSLTVDAPDDLAEAYGDRTRIAQVVVNLMSNAARFTDQGGITVRAEERGEELLVSVADTGPGISEEDQQAIWEPFCQGISPSRADRGGSGLGLSISKEFIERHGGKIWLESQLGRGTTFYFSLPLAPPQPVAGRAGHWIVSEWLVQEREPRDSEPARLEQRIIVQDPAGSLYNLVSRYADEVEYVRTHDAVETARSLEATPAFMVMVNANSPGVLIPAMRQVQDVIAHTPVVGCCVGPMASRAVSAGASGYLIKPLRREHLREVIEGLDRTVERVLVVDDEPEQCQMMAMLLKSIDPGLTVTLALDGQEALARMTQDAPDLVLLDIIMPGMDGWEVLEARRHLGDESAPVIMVSAEDPSQRPVTSDLIVGAIGSGLSVGKIVSCSKGLSALLRQPD